MVKRQFRVVTGITGLLVAGGINGLLNDQGEGWVGSAYAQDAESWEEEANAGEADESSAEEAGDDESMEETAATENDSGVEEESEPVEDLEAVEDSEATASAQDAAAEQADAPVAEEPAQSDPAIDAAAEEQVATSPQEAPQSQIAARIHGKADRVREVLYQHTREILPDLASHDFKGSDSLKSLGANSVDRSEIVMMTLESLNLTVPLIELAKAENLDELAGLIASKMP